MRTVFAVALMAGLTAFPAEAGWQGAEWGMSESAFLARFPHASRSGRSFTVSPAPTRSAKATSARFDFPRGELYRIVVSYEGIGYEQLKASVAAQFGQAVSTEEGVCTPGRCRKRSTFIDSQRGNVVSVEEFLGDQYVMYMPLETSF